MQKLNRKERQQILYKAKNKATGHEFYMSEAGLGALLISEKERAKYEYDLETQYVKVRDKYMLVSELEAQKEASAKKAVSINNTEIPKPYMPQTTESKTQKTKPVTDESK